MASSSSNQFSVGNKKLKSFLEKAPRISEDKKVLRLCNKFPTTRSGMQYDAYKKKLKVAATNAATYLTLKSPNNARDVLNDHGVSYQRLKTIFKILSSIDSMNLKQMCEALEGIIKHFSKKVSSLTLERVYGSNKIISTTFKTSDSSEPIRVTLTTGNALKNKKPNKQEKKYTYFNDGLGNNHVVETTTIVQDITPDYYFDSKCSLLSNETSCNNSDVCEWNESSNSCIDYYRWYNPSTWTISPSL